MKCLYHYIVKALAPVLLALTACVLPITLQAQPWEALSPERQEQLSPERQDQVQSRMQRFNELTPEKRQKLIKGFKRFKDMSPEQRKALRQKWQTLSPEEKALIRGNQ